MLKRLYTSAAISKVYMPQPKTNGRTAAARQINGHTLRNDCVYTVTRAISARVNQNYDGFPSDELKKAHTSFIGRPVFVNHNNEDHRRTRGIIVDSTYKEAGSDKYIELLIEIDAKNFPKLASLISTGELDSVSMGTDVEFTRCSYCKNVAYEVEDFCDHVRNNKGQTLSKIGANGRREDVLVYESCHGLNFFEISYVFDPADETAINQRVYLPKRSSKVASMQKRSLGEVTAPESVDTLRPQESCPQCGDEDFDGKECNMCDYVRPPEEFQDPDTMKSRVLQIVRKDPADSEFIRNTPPGANGKEGMHMGNTPTDSRLKAALARKRLAEAQRRLADADMTTDQARESDSTDVENIDQQFTSEEEAREPDSTTDVTKLPADYKSSAVARNRAAYLQRKRADFGQDDPSQAPGADPQAADPASSDGPNSGPPTDSTPGDTGGIDGLPIDWKQDESGQPYGTVQGTDLDIFVNEDMSWQVLPEGSNEPIAQGQGSSYDDCVQQAFQQAESLGSQGQDQGQGQDPSADPAAGADPAAAGGAPSGPPAQDPTKVSKMKRKRAQGETPEDAAPDERTDVTNLPKYDTLTDNGGTFNAKDYDDNAMRNKTTPVDGSDKQNFAPGGEPFSSNNKKATVQRVSSAKVFALLETYTNIGLVANNKQARMAAVADIEKLHPAIVNDRIAVLSLVENAMAKAAANRPRNAVPQRAAGRVPAMGRAATNSTSSSDLDTLMTL